MKLTTKTRYGVRALFDMAFHAGTLPVQVKDISRRQEISPRYLEQIFQLLKKAGLLRSKRGPQGGYALTRLPAEEDFPPGLRRGRSGQEGRVDPL